MNLIDKLICEFDTGLRTVFAPALPHRPSPGKAQTNENLSSLSKAEQDQSIRLMRINHCGEICAQALYQGQALVARDEHTRQLLKHAAQEEHDHLAWCEGRLSELGGAKTVFNPFWYVASYGLGVLSGLAGDRWSMGFLVETEKQVEKHLDNHLTQLPLADSRSRQIIEKMREDEIKHGETGKQQGAIELPALVKQAMRLASKLMTRTTYWV